MAAKRRGGKPDGQDLKATDHKKNAQDPKGKSEKKKHTEAESVVATRNSFFWWSAVLLLAVAISCVHQDHLFKLFEGDKHFSHLSNLEREMAFRTEMGLYYSYFKTIIHAPSFWDGLHQITKDNVTEYPDTINTLKRFNLYPEVILGAAYRYANSNGWLKKVCYKVNRDQGKAPVQSCEGTAEPTYFYVSAVMILNGLMMGTYFLFGTFLSESIFGGLVTVACYFFNHGEATRVMWTPPLRESFAFPALVAETFYISYVLKKANPSVRDVLFIAILVISFMLPWQFAQFALMTQLVAVFGCYVLCYINKHRMKIVLAGHAIGLLSSYVFLFGNEMLLTSFFASCIMTVFIIVTLEPVLLKLRFRLLIIAVQGVLLLAGMVGVKILVSKLLQAEDDAHITDILKSKFTDFKTFDTLLYTCAKEFDFLEMETITKFLMSGLLPTMIVVIIVVAVTLSAREVANFWYNKSEGLITYPPSEGRKNEKQHAEILYNILQLFAFVVMAVIIMRLKLFATPQICLICGLIASRQIFGPYIPQINIHRAVVVGVIALMAVQGVPNLRRQWSIQGEYSNYPLEDLIEWINKTTSPDAVFGGPMSTMANIKLSTLRPIVNHPHYEDVGIRLRTKKIYTMTSRKTIQELYEVIKEMRAEYIVYEQGWCLRSGAKPGCTSPEIWDVEDPANAGKGKQPLCVVMERKSEPYFKKVYHNEKFDVYRIIL